MIETAMDGARLEWIDGTPGHWERVSEPPKPFPLKPTEGRVKLAHSTAAKLVESDEFTVTWELAKSLASLPPEVARRDIAASWDSVTALCDLKTLLDCIHFIRRSAVERYIDQREIARAVTKHLESQS